MEKLFATSHCWICLTVSKKRISRTIQRESNLKMKERLLLTLRVEVDGGGEVPAHVVQERTP